MKEYITLVDENDNEIGFEEKLRVHELGKLHRAFSIFVFNERYELLIQKRAKTKYHSGGLWTNTCCSHPRYEEGLEEAIHRRLLEEMGFDCALKKAFDFIYRAEFENGLIEHEYDHVFIGNYSNGGKIWINLAEAEDYKWVGFCDLEKDTKENPETYSYWFKVAFPKVIDSINGLKIANRPFGITGYRKLR